MRFFLLSSSCLALLAASCGSSSDDATRLTADAPSFGSVLAGDVVTSRVTVKNRTEAATKFAPLVFLEADPAVTTLTTTCTAPLAAGAECDATIEWRPSAAGDLIGSLVILDDPTDAAQVDSWVRLGQPSRAARSTDLVLTLKGTALPPDRLEVSPASISWVTYDAMQPRVLHLASTGHAPARTAFTLGGPGADNFGVSSCAPVLQPGEACDVYVFPLPAQKGRHTARVAFDHAGCDLEIASATELLGSPDPTVPTHETLRALTSRWDASASKPSVMIVGEHGAALRGDVGAWKNLSIPGGEGLLRVVTYGSEDFTSDGKKYTFPEDERDLIFAGGTRGALFVSRKGAPFTPLASGLTSDVVGLAVNSWASPLGSNYVMRPHASVHGSDGQNTYSDAFAPPTSDSSASLPGPWTFVEDAFYPVSSDRWENCRIAGGDHGALTTLTSDGKPHVASGLSDALHGALPNGGLLLVGEHGAIYTSKDCQTWTREESGTTVTLRGAYALSGSTEGQRVVVGDGGTVLVSRDGGPWIKVPLRTEADLYAVGYTGSFVAVGANGTVVRFY